MTFNLEWLWPILANLPIAQYVQTQPWAYPALETVHVIGLGLLFGGIVLFDLRVIGFGRSLSLNALKSYVLPLVWLGFALNATSGILLFLSDAVEFAGNIALWSKLSLIALAGLNAAVFQWIYAGHARGNTLELQQPPAALKASAFVSLALWLCAITAGRLIAYVA